VENKQFNTGESMKKWILLILAIILFGIFSLIRSCQRSSREVINVYTDKEIEYFIGKLAKKFAEEIKVPRSSVSHILSMRNNPSLDFIMKIKHRFPDLEWSWLIEGKGNMLLPSSTFHNKFIDNSATNLSTIELTGNISDNPILRENEIKEYTPLIVVSSVVIFHFPTTKAISLFNLLTLISEKLKIPIFSLFG